MKDIIKGVIGNLDKGFYRAAQSVKDSTGNPVKRCSYGYLTDLMIEKGIGPTESDLQKRTEAMLVRAGIPVEKQSALSDPVRFAYEQYAFDTWGLDKALQNEGIRVKGAQADRIEKFFATTTSTVLFPTYVESQVVAGILAEPLLQNLIMAETNINAHVYESLAMADTAADRELRLMGEGAKLPTTKITTADRSINLFKFGRILEATYEALKLQRINVVSLFLQRMGRQIAIDETDWAITVLISGDGNTGSGITNANDIDADVQGTLDYDELTKLFLGFNDGYNMTTAVTRDTNMRRILNMAEFKDPTAGFTFQRNGVLPGPMGASWYRWNSTGNTALTAQAILAIDARVALEQVTEQGVMTESDKLIDTQFERTAISKWTGFAKSDYNGVQVLDVNAEI
jgi:preprotein translocase subunit SecB